MIKARRGGQKYARTEAEREVFTRQSRWERGGTKVESPSDYGLPPSVFQNKDSPDYKPNYGKKFTERQLKILNEEIPIEEVRLTEISIIMRKAESLGDEENLDIARMLYAFKTHKEEYQFNIAAEDAKRTLQDLTPWEIDWNK